MDTDVTRGLCVADMLENCCPSYDLVVLRAESVFALRNHLASHRISVVFCDARTHTNVDEMVKAVRRIVPLGSREQVVYTGVSEQNLVALERDDYAFLLPSDADTQEVALALRKALTRYDERSERPIAIRTKQRVYAVQPSLIRYAESALRKVRIHVGGEVVEVYAKLSDFQNELPCHFVQCHKSFVVNMSFIKEIAQEHALLSTGELIPISQKRRKAMRAAFLDYIGRAI